MCHCHRILRFLPLHCTLSSVSVPEKSILLLFVVLFPPLLPHGLLFLSKRVIDSAENACQLRWESGYKADEVIVVTLIKPMKPTQKRRKSLSASILAERLTRCDKISTEKPRFGLQILTFTVSRRLRHSQTMMSLMMNFPCVEIFVVVAAGDRQSRQLNVSVSSGFNATPKPSRINLK